MGWWFGDFDLAGICYSVGHGLGLSSTVHEIMTTKLSIGLHTPKAVWSDGTEGQTQVVLKVLFGPVDITLTPARTWIKYNQF